MNEILYHVVVEILEQSEGQKSCLIWLFDKSLRFLLISLCETQEGDWEKKLILEHIIRILFQPKSYCICPKIFDIKLSTFGSMPFNLFQYSTSQHLSSKS